MNLVHLIAYLIGGGFASFRLRSAAGANRAAGYAGSQ